MPWAQSLDRRINHGAVMNGLIYDMPETDYRAIDAVSQSVLKNYKTSPAHGRAAEIGEKKFKRHFNIGHAGHQAALEPMRFRENTAIIPDEMPDAKGQMKPTNKNMSSYKAWEAANEGKLILSAEERDHVVEMMMSVHRHPLVGAYLGRGKSEVSGFTEMETSFIDRESGEIITKSIKVKARFDWLHSIDGLEPFILDIKTTQDASKSDFQKSISNFGYHIQAAFYLQIARLLGYEATCFKIVAVEKEPPFAVALYTVSEHAIEMGNREYQKLLSIYAMCHHHQEWYGYSEEDQIIDLPAWHGKGAL